MEAATSHAFGKATVKNLKHFFIGDLAKPRVCGILLHESGFLPSDFGAGCAAQGFVVDATANQFFEEGLPWVSCSNNR
jgi:hypothetical protein